MCTSVKKHDIIKFVVESYSLHTNGLKSPLTN